MKVLSSNVALTFICENESCPKHETSQSDPAELCISGVPICLTCNEEMTLQENCFIKN